MLLALLLQGRETAGLGVVGIGVRREGEGLALGCADVGVGTDAAAFGRLWVVIWMRRAVGVLFCRIIGVAGGGRRGE